MPFGFALGSAAVLSMLSGCAFFASAEYSLAAANKSKLLQLSRTGNLRARRALELATHYSRFLSAMRLGLITLTVFSGALAGVWSASVIAEALTSPSTFANTAAGLISALLLSLATIFLGELLPRRLAQRHPETWAMAVSGPLWALFVVTSPVLRALHRISESIFGIFGLEPPNNEAALAEEEIKTLVREGTAAGVFQKSERDMMERVLAFGDRKVASLMTPRPDITWLDIDDSMNINREKMRNSPHSHFPVARGSLDTLVGTVHVKDFLCRKSIDDFSSLAEFIAPPLFVPESMTGLELLERFKNTGRHIAFVIDEFGAIQGLATMTDILEALVGALPSGSPAQAQCIKLQENVWVVDGGLPIDEFKRAFGLMKLPDEERAGFLTMAGFLLSLLGKIPREGEITSWGGFQFRVERMRANRIDKVRVVTGEGFLPTQTHAMTEVRSVI